jgi:N-methylhydantoinase A
MRSSRAIHRFVTEGLPISVLREGGKLDPFRCSSVSEPYVPRRLTFEIRERKIPRATSRRRGTSPDAAYSAGRGVLAIAAVAVVARRPGARTGARAADRKSCPAFPTLISSAEPDRSEWRASSAAIDASLKPFMQAHLNDMEADLARAGFRGELLVATSFGGVMHLADVVQRPVYLVKSGPAMAPVAGRTYADAEVGPSDIIVCDTGGTSFDVSLVRDGLIKFTRELGWARLSRHITACHYVISAGWLDAWIDPTAAERGRGSRSRMLRPREKSDDAAVASRPGFPRCRMKLFHSGAMWSAAVTRRQRHAR